MNETVRLTREELYDLVWSKPMTTVAAEFGMSSVAFAKHCEKLDVPRPGRGHWQQLASGHHVKRDPLPKLTPGMPSYVEITRHAKRPTPPVSAPAPAINVGDALRKPHAALVQIQEKLRGPKGQECGSIPGDGHAVFKAWGAARKRALLILDALFKALDARGHTVRLGNARYSRERHAISVTAAGKPPVELWIIEHLSRSDHVPTEEERKHHEKYSWSLAPTYDFENSGRLILEIDTPWDSGLRKRWADGTKQRLESLLGDVVIGIEMAADAAYAEEQHRQEERDRDAEVKRRAADEQRRAVHRQAVSDDLLKMADRWRVAQNLRQFLAAVAEKVPEPRSEGFAAWLAWAVEHAEHVDPLREPTEIAKLLDPKNLDAR